MEVNYSLICEEEFERKIYYIDYLRYTSKTDKKYMLSWERCYSYNI